MGPYSAFSMDFPGGVSLHPLLVSRDLELARTWIDSWLPHMSDLAETIGPPKTSFQ
jgi:hypothetical protein